MLTVVWWSPALTLGQGPEFQPNALAVVVHGVLEGAEGERLGGLASVEGDAGRHAGVVGGGRPALLGLGLTGMVTVRSGSALRVTVTAWRSALGDAA